MSKLEATYELFEPMKQQFLNFYLEDKVLMSFERAFRLPTVNNYIRYQKGYNL